MCLLNCWTFQMIGLPFFFILFQAQKLNSMHVKLTRQHIAFTFHYHSINHIIVNICFGLDICLRIESLCNDQRCMATGTQLSIDFLKKNSLFDLKTKKNGLRNGWYQTRNTSYRVIVWTLKRNGKREKPLLSVRNEDIERIIYTAFWRKNRLICTPN